MPAPQGMQLVKPVLAPKKPAGQGRHTPEEDAPVEAEYLPTVQGMHIEAPVDEL